MFGRGVECKRCARIVIVSEPAMRDRLEALTGLRFMAAGLVVLHHTARHFRPGLVPEAEGLFGFVLRGLNDVLIAGNEAVRFFFVLSGAVLAYTYLDHTGTMRAAPGPITTGLGSRGYIRLIWWAWSWLRRSAG